MKDLPPITDRCPVPAAKPWLRPLFLLFGWLCVVLAFIGAILPGIPTTVFLIAAAWAFARSSRRFHGWLYGHRTFGPMLIAWERYRVIPLPAKILAVTMMTASFLYVVLFVAESWVLPTVMLTVMVPAALYVVTRASRIPA